MSDPLLETKLEAQARSSYLEVSRSESQTKPLEGDFFDSN